MRETVEQQDAEGERLPESGSRGGELEAAVRARSQAALVRESLVRCPPAAESSAE
jgi:hypothetical protein